MCRACLAVLLLALTPVGGCGSSSHPPEGGDAGAADSGRPPDCAGDPQAEGCPCDGAPAACFDGDHSQVNVGLCRAGLQRCEEGRWTPCYGATQPAAAEVCDGQDEDCDGVVDDGVQNDCGTCEGDCEVLWIGTGNFDPGRESSGVVEDDDGALVVDALSRVASRLWIGSGTDGTVSVLDTEERRVTGRYLVTDDAVDEEALAVAATPWGGALVSVGSSVHNEGEKLVRIGLAPCPDTNGDGILRTSSGYDDVLPFGDDDCVLWQVEFDDRIRGVAWEPRTVLGGREDFIWVGGTDALSLIELDDQGEPTGREVDLGFAPAGVVLMPDGRLAVASAWPFGQFMFLETEDLDTTYVSIDGGSSLCSIATDLVGNVYIPNDLGSQKIDAETGHVTHLSECLASVAASEEVFWGSWCDRELVTTTTELEDLTRYALPEPVGDVAGVPWVALTTTDELWIMDAPSGSVMRFDVATEEFETIIEDIPSPGTCGDVTGVSVMRDAGTPVHYQHRFDGCDETTTWTLLFWEAETPPGTEIHFSVQVANDEVGLARAPIVAVGSAPAGASSLPLGPFFEDGGPRGAILVVHASLQSAGQATPRLLDLGVARVCEE